jgi:hypothetical protein
LSVAAAQTLLLVSTRARRAVRAALTPSFAQVAVVVERGATKPVPVALVEALARTDKALTAVLAQQVRATVAGTTSPMTLAQEALEPGAEGLVVRVTTCRQTPQGLEVRAATDAHLTLPELGLCTQAVVAVVVTLWGAKAEKVAEARALPGLLPVPTPLQIRVAAAVEVVRTQMKPRSVGATEAQASSWFGTQAFSPLQQLPEVLRSLQLEQTACTHGLLLERGQSPLISTSRVSGLDGSIAMYEELSLEA